MSLFKKDGAELRGETIISLPNGNTLLGGSEDEASLLIELSPEGTIVWSGTLDVQPGQSEIIRTLTQDSEGNILCMGTEDATNYHTYIIKFNPATKSIEWITSSTDSDHIIYDVLNPVGFDYYIGIGARKNSTSPGLGVDACLRSIDKNTGEFTSDLSTNYHLGSAESFISAQLYGGYIYTTGRYNAAGGGFNKMRIAVSKFDLSGNVIWTRLLVQPGSINARTYGSDLTIKNGDIYFVGEGDPNGTSATDTEAYIGKMDLDGNLIWAREYDFSGIQRQSFISVSITYDGLLVSCAEQ